MTVTWNGDAVNRRIRQAILRGVFIAAEFVRETAIESIVGGQKTGEVYTTKFFTIGRGAGRIIVPYSSRPPHQASGENEAPASDTGRLVNSSQVLLDEARLSATVNFAARYAEFLEIGTDKVEARPFLRPALNKSRDRIARIIAEEIRNELQ